MVNKNKGNTMDKLSSIIKYMFVLVFVSSLTFAQYDTNTTQSEGTEDNMLGMQDDDQFRQSAMTLAQDLQSRLTLTNDQVEEITDILVDYKDEIATIKRDKSDEMRAGTHEDNDNIIGDNTGTTGTGTTETETDRTDTDIAENDTRTDDEGNLSGDDAVTNDGEMLGGRTDYDEKFREADMSANEDIEGVLEEGQLAKYIQIKRDWWDTVKDRVHSAAASENLMEDVEEEIDEKD